MTTFFPAQPAPNSIVQFQPTLTDLNGNAAQYAANVTWNLYGVRWYFNLAQLNGTRLLTRPLIATPAARNIQSLSWSNGAATATMTKPHGWAQLSTMPLTIAGSSPAAYNGDVMAFVTSPITVQWQLSQDPGMATKVGTASYDVNLVGGYFASKVLFRNGQFEVAP